MSEEQTPRRWTAGDTVLVAGVILAAAACLWLWLTPHEGVAAQVTADGEVIAVLPLDTDTEFSVPGTDGEENRLIIADGQAKMVFATCPDQICVRHRAISRTGQSIVCLPHGVVVTVVGGAPELDGELG